MFRNLIFITLLVAVSATAQVRMGNWAERVFSPGPQTASGQDAWSLFQNPAGLSFIDGAQLVGGYAHHWNNPPALHQVQFSAGFGLFKGLAVGLGLNLALPDTTKPGIDEGLLNGQFGLAYRFGSWLSIGAWAFKQRQYALQEANPFLFGGGFQIYPSSWLALGVSYKQAYAGFSKPAVFEAGVSSRPFGEIFTVFTDTRLFPKSDKWSDGFLVDPIAGFRLDLESISLIGHAVIKSNPLFMIAVDFNFGQFGLGILAGNEYAGTRFRLSSEEAGNLISKPKKWVQIEINSHGTVKQEFSTLTAKLFSKPISPLFFLNSLEDLAKDESVEGVIIHFEPLELGFGRAEELRAALLNLKAHKKQVIAYLNQANVADYYVASAADKVYLNPAGEIRLDDFRSTLIYLKEALDKLGVQADAIMAGKYKNAPKPLISTKPSKEELEVKNYILNERYELFSRAIAQKSDSSFTQAKKQIDLNRMTSHEALEAKLVNETIEEDESPQGNISFLSYYQAKPLIKPWGEPHRIAIIPITGTIVRENSPDSFFFSKSETSAKDTVSLIQAAAANPKVKGILVRVDSPGGDAFASEQIYQALIKARKKKPVVTSMGDIAASGGYFAAAATDSIWAEPSTLTGSIGVFALSVSAENLFKKLGVASFEISKTAMPGPSLFRPLNHKERARAQDLVNWHYDRFTKSVSNGQKLDLKHVLKVAEGRVWTGKQALDNKLVHHLGGFNEALKDLKKRTKLKDSQKIRLTIYRKSHFNFFGFPPPLPIGALNFQNGQVLALSNLSERMDSL